jgi:hypothetical protein
MVQKTSYSNTDEVIWDSTEGRPAASTVTNRGLNEATHQQGQKTERLATYVAGWRACRRIEPSRKQMPTQVPCQSQYSF